MSLNEEQQSHVDYLNSLDPDVKCGCGWYLRTECWDRCGGFKQRPEDKVIAVEVEKIKKKMIEQCARIAEDVEKMNWPLKDPEAERLQSQRRLTANGIKHRIRALYK